MEQARESAKSLGPDLDVKFYRFDGTLNRCEAGRARPRAGGPRDRPRFRPGRCREESGTECKRIARMVILSDFASNNGTTPRRGSPAPRSADASRHRRPRHRERRCGIPGHRRAGHRHGPTVFVKNQLEVRGNARGPRVRQPAHRRRDVRRGRRPTPVAKTR